MRKNPITIALICGIIVGIVIIFMGYFATVIEMPSSSQTFTWVMESATQAICNAIGWLIIALGATDVVFFSYKLVKYLYSNDKASSTTDKNSIPELPDL